MPGVVTAPHRAALLRLTRQPEALAAGAALLANLLWEFAQSPFYRDTYVEPIRTVVLYRLHCTAGDVLILLSAWLAASLIGRSRWWFCSLGPASLAVFLIGGLGYTVFSEWRATSVTGAWAYSSAMPTVAGVGLLPIAQWIVLPPVVLRFVRRAKCWQRPPQGAPHADP